MLDLKFIRENREQVEQAISAKKSRVNLDQLLELDNEKRKLQFDFDTNRSHQNKISKEIAQIKKQKGDASTIITEMQTLSTTIKDISGRLSNIETEIDNILVNIPNLPDSSVPLGGEENNELVREWGVKWDERPQFTQKPYDHLELAEGLKLIDLSRGAKISGSGFPVYTGIGASLERALINYMLDFHLNNHGYQELATPILVNRQAMYGTGQIPKLEDDMYRITEDDLFLIPTGEVPVTNYYAGEILQNEQLPVKFVAYTPCFRREAGSYGKETKGLQRLHQFNKVELVRFVRPENSWEALEEMLTEAEAILKSLDLPYRVLKLATGDLSFASAKTYDIEVWVPGMQKYLEVSSLSNFLDFQARRASIRYRNEQGKVSFLHTLNGSGLATPRTFIALLENYQNSDGSITIPEPLQPYLGGLQVIKPV